MATVIKKDFFTKKISSMVSRLHPWELTSMWKQPKLFNAETRDLEVNELSR